MTIEKIRELYVMQPFHPFIMHLANGRQVNIKSREFMASSPSGRVVMVYEPDGKLDMIDLLLVTDVEVEPSRPMRAQGRRE